MICTQFELPEVASPSLFFVQIKIGWNRSCDAYLTVGESGEAGRSIH